MAYAEQIRMTEVQRKPNKGFRNRDKVICSIFSAREISNGSKNVYHGSRGETSVGWSVNWNSIWMTLGCKSAVRGRFHRIHRKRAVSSTIK